MATITHFHGLLISIVNVVGELTFENFRQMVAPKIPRVCRVRSTNSQNSGLWSAMDQSRSVIYIVNVVGERTFENLSQITVRLEYQDECEQKCSEFARGVCVNKSVASSRHRFSKVRCIVIVDHNRS